MDIARNILPVCIGLVEQLIEGIGKYEQRNIVTSFSLDIDERLGKADSRPGLALNAMMYLLPLGKSVKS